jgi:hypothetical protein
MIKYQKCVVIEPKPSFFTFPSPILAFNTFCLSDTAKI